MMRFDLTIVAFLSFVCSACSKVPLQYQPGSFSHLSAHWFETEKVGYVFFALNEMQPRLSDPRWSLSYRHDAVTGGTTDVPEFAIDPDSGVHAHSWDFCGSNTFCGSYSFKSDKRPTSLTLRFQYDADSDLDLTQTVAVSAHAADGTANAYSALMYGVFDKTNQHVQIEVHDNFGTPEASLIHRYGLHRRFKVSDAGIRNVAAADMTAANKAVGSDLLFPATFCKDTASTSNKSFSGTSTWLPETFDSAIAGGVCFKAVFLDKANTPLVTAPVPGFSRRNPELSEPSLTLTTPLKPVLKIPIVVKICDDDPLASSMMDGDFFSYQRFILRMQDRPADVCFYLGSEVQFKDNFAKHLDQRLAAAKIGNSDNLDLMFVVILHHRFGIEFNAVQSAVAGSLAASVESERQNTSPRLVGAFVYDANMSFNPTAEQRLYMQWCPQELDRQITASEFRLSDQNCTIVPALALDLKIINFVAPLGPLPSIDAYKDYVKKYGDKGLAKNPDLNFYSVPIGPSSRTELNETVTYFDNQRFTLAANQYAKLCTNRLGGENLLSISNFRFRTVGMDETFDSYTMLNINLLWLNDRPADESYRIGIKWEYLFWGGINYNAALSGKIGSIIPYTRSSKSYETLGDAKWQTQSWPFGEFVQMCTRYCDNPMFDENGVYNIRNSFRAIGNLSCPQPSYPIWDGGAS